MNSRYLKSALPAIPAVALYFLLYIFCGSVLTVQASGLPQWLKDTPRIPEWWSQVNVPFTNEDTSSNKWAVQKAMEQRIKSMVIAGASPTEQRRQLIKYLTLFSGSGSLSPDDRLTEEVEIADIYSRLGDHKRSAKVYADLTADPFTPALTSHYLAIECERVGDNGYALEVYHEITQNHSDDRMSVKIAKDRISCLSRTNRDCILTKPPWWIRFQDEPPWFDEMAITLPAITSFQDGFVFIAHNVPSAPEPRKSAKAWTLLSQFTPLTINEKAMVFMLAAQAYAASGDHNRAIESAWRIPEQLSGDIGDSTNALNYIASEFEKLNELEHAREIRDQIPCFGKERQ
jgi:hypothetical protein